MPSITAGFVLGLNKFEYTPELPEFSPRILEDINVETILIAELGVNKPTLIDGVNC